MFKFPSQLVDAIVAAAQEAPQVIAAYAFGSTARGAAHPRDLDIALLWDESAPEVSRWRVEEQFALGVERRMPERRNVEVVDLRRAAPSLQHRILSEGIRVLDRDRVQRTRFEALAWSMAVDFLEWQRPYVERWRRTVSGGR